MGKILDMLYAGELHPADRLDEDMRAEFDTLMEHYLELTFMEKSHTFSHGFRLGAGIMCEVFCENGRDQA